MSIITEVIVAGLLIIGTIIMLLGSLGLIRFGDIFLRMHAATKSGTLGISFLLAGVAIYFGDSLTTIKLVALMAIYFMTSPIGAQVLAHAAHIAKIPLVKETWIDDLAESYSANLKSEIQGNNE